MSSQEVTMRQQLSRYTAALTSFKTSPSNFRILHSHPSTPISPPRTLYILDSSFNPPTVAHLHLVTSAILKDSKPSPSPKRILLLLATKNADKADSPASFEHRLTMMEIFASDLREALPKKANSEESKEEAIGVDIGVTKLPYFMDKASAIEESYTYPPSTEMVHLIGFDTLIRFLDPKYYPPSYSLKVLDPFFKKNRLRVTYRNISHEVKAREEAWKEQDNYLAAVKDGKRDIEGGNKDWVNTGRIEMCEGREGDVVSSTRVREAVKKGNKEELKELVTRGVADWIIGNGLYAET